MLGRSLAAYGTKRKVVRDGDVSELIRPRPFFAPVKHSHTVQIEPHIGMGRRAWSKKGDMDRDRGG